MGAPKRRLPSALAANRWRPGQSGNPSGHSGEYGEAMRLARQAAPDAVRRLTEMAEVDDSHRHDDESLLPFSSGADHRVVTVAANALIERAFGKPREYDPTAEQAQQKPAFDPSLYTFEELEQLYAALAIVARRQGLLLPSM
jgi:hypothetical protein